MYRVVPQDWTSFTHNFVHHTSGTGHTVPAPVSNLDPGCEASPIPCVATRRMPLGLCVDKPQGSLIRFVAVHDNLPCTCSNGHKPTTLHTYTLTWA